jgi:serine protease Do
MRSMTLLLSLFLHTAGICNPIPHQVPLSGEHQEAFADIVDATIGGVVSITSTQLIRRSDMMRGEMPGSPFEDLFREFFKEFGGRESAEPPRKVQGLGSGFIIKADNENIYIVTNYHVVADAKKLSVKFFIKKEIEGHLHAHDARTDLAVVRCPISKFSNEERKKLRVLTWGDSEKVRVGHWTLAIGTPFGLGNTVTAGIISAKGRDLLLPGNKAADLGEFFQHTAAINSGNSGGCLLNTQGQVIGINTVILTPNGGNVGVGFAICSTIAKNVVDQLIEKKQVKRGYIGISISKVPDDQRIHLGLKNDQDAFKVGQVNVGGPGEKAGVKPGDIITHFNGKPVLDNWRRLVSETAPGASVTLTILRDEKGSLKPLEIKVKIGEAPASMSSSTATSKPSTVAGLLLSPVTISGNDNIKGLRIEKMDSRLQREEIDIRPKDIITAIRFIKSGIAVRQSVHTVETFKKLVKAFKDAKQESIVLEIIREDASGSIVNLVTFPLDSFDEKEDNKKDDEEKSDGEE